MQTAVDSSMRADDGRHGETQTESNGLSIYRQQTYSCRRARQQRVGSAQDTDMPLMIVDRRMFWTVFKLDSEFVSNSK